MADSLEDRMKSSIPRPALAFGGIIIALSLSLNLVGINFGPIINDWMELKIEQAKNRLATNKKLEIKIQKLEKRLEKVELLAHESGE